MSSNGFVADVFASFFFDVADGTSVFMSPSSVAGSATAGFTVCCCSPLLLRDAFDCFSVLLLLVEPSRFNHSIGIAAHKTRMNAIKATLTDCTAIVAWGSFRPALGAISSSTFATQYLRVDL